MRKLLLFIISSIFILSLIPVAVRAEESTGSNGEEKTGEELSSLPLFIIEPAESMLKIDGNNSRYRHYVSPPEDTFLGYLGVFYNNKEGRPLLDLALYDVGEDSFGGDFRLSIENGRAVLKGNQRRSSFYWENGPDSLSRMDQAYKLTMPVGRGDLNLSYSGIKLSSASDTDLPDWTTSTSSIGYKFHVNNWLASMGYESDCFKFGDGPQFDGDTRTLNFSLRMPETERTSLEAAGALMRTSLDDYDTGPRRFNFAVEGVHQLTDDVTLSGEVLHYKINNAIAETAYASGKTGTKAKAEFTGISGTVVDVGGGLAKVDYMNDLHTASVDSDENSFFAKINTRLSKRWRFKASHSQDWTNNRPVAFNLEGDPIGSLAWSDRMDQRLEAYYTPNWKSGISCKWRNLEWKNSDLSTKNSLVESDIYGWVMVSDVVTLYTTYMNQDFGIHNDDTDRLLTTDNKTFVYGATCQLSEGTSLDVSVSDTDSNEWGEDHTGVAVGFNFRLADDMNLFLRVAIDDLTSSGDSALDYNANYFEASFSKSF